MEITKRREGMDLDPVGGPQTGRAGKEGTCRGLPESGERKET
jgi:hypothetical protein